MPDFAEPLARLIQEFKRLPGVGQKSAQRLAFHVLRAPREDAQQLAQAVLDVKDKRGIGPEQLRIKNLLERLAAGEVREIILATNPTVEGEATAVYLSRLLKPLGVRVTRIAMGIPVGSDLEFADEVTMSKSLENRREM